jgi:hypothetical protein
MSSGDFVDQRERRVEVGGMGQVVISAHAGGGGDSGGGGG